MNLIRRLEPAPVVALHDGVVGIGGTDAGFTDLLAGDAGLPLRSHERLVLSHVLRYLLVADKDADHTAREAGACEAMVLGTASRGLCGPRRRRSRRGRGLLRGARRARAGASGGLGSSSVDGLRSVLDGVSIAAFVDLAQRIRHLRVGGADRRNTWPLLLKVGRDCRLGGASATLDADMQYFLGGGGGLHVGGGRIGAHKVSGDRRQRSHGRYRDGY
mmetsp:Transcript_18449/g.37700  ORF Transcript_18449/g.37700 Transcript_18449/m.37700 type:complete len:217 (+) Transcript_18449:875-1525(+)